MKNEDDDDDSFFGDFPDFDVDEAAKVALAQRDQNVNNQMPITTGTTKATTGDDGFFDDDWTEEDMAALEADACLQFTRYRVLAVRHGDNIMMKELTLATWTTDMLRQEEQALRKRHHPFERSTTTTTEEAERQWSSAGVLTLEGSWSQTDVRVGDTIHLCSLLGRTMTHRLPKSVGRGGDKDDLVMIVHPDLLLAPTIISEGVSCPRRAVLKSRLGSTGLTST
jgi:DNA replication factor Dna2